MKKMRINLIRIWNEAKQCAWYDAFERHLDGMPRPENDKQIRRDRIRIFLSLLRKELVCTVVGHRWHYEEVGDCESGPDLYVHCERCGLSR